MNRKIIFYCLILAAVASGLIFLCKHFKISGNNKVEIEFKKSEETGKNMQNIEEKEELSPEISNNKPKSGEEQEGEVDMGKEENENEETNETGAGIKINNKLISWGYKKSEKRAIDTAIVHSSYNALGGDEYSLEKLISEYKSYGVSPHYLVDRKGTIFRLVEDKNIAYHAGESKMPDGRNNVNNFSIGIEMMNAKDDKCTASQYSSLKKLLAYLKGNYAIKYVLGHSDVAKGRKDDPWNFDWSEIK